MFDCAIIGTGPAGLSAALTLKARNKSFIWFGSRTLSIKVEKAERIMNYPGLIRVSGAEMTSVFQKQIQDAGLEITEKTVTGVYDMGSYYGILCNQDMFEAKTIILSTGVALNKSIPGEEENVGNGVSYCATCDGFLYKGKEIAVVIQDESYMEEVEYLAELAARVYLIPLYKDAICNLENVVVLRKRPKELTRTEAVNLVFDDEVLSVAGAFFLKSAVAPDILVPGIEAKDGHIVVNRQCETNLKGCYAAGDITGKPYQYTKAVGEGNIAAHSAIAYLAKEKQNESGNL